MKKFVDAKREAKINDMMNSFNKPATNEVPNPFGPPSKDTTQSKSNAFNIDDIVKKIDAKIAELEEQERLEQLEKTKTKTDVKEEVKEDIKVEETPVSNDVITDDQFFDDFFNDED